MPVLPAWGRRVLSSGRTLRLRHGSYGLMRQSRYLISPLAMRPRSRCLCRLLSAPAANRTFPTLSLRIFPQVPDPMPRQVSRSAFACFFLRASASPRSRVGRLPASYPRTRLSTDRLFEAADIPLCSSPRVCSPPRSFPPLCIQPQGGRDFYIRAERASLPQHAPDMLTVRFQAIDGTRTLTSLDSQPCRLLPASCRFSPAHCNQDVSRQ